jgi:ABC-type Na+ efflux pump permease subunit
MQKARTPIGEFLRAILALLLTSVLVGPLTYLMLYRIPIINYHITEGPHHLVWVLGVPFFVAVLLYRKPFQAVVAWLALIPVTLVLTVVFFFGVFGLDY